MTEINVQDLIDILKWRTNRRGYFETSVTQHRLIWTINKGPIPKGYDVHHKDGNRKNNSLENLILKEHKSHSSEHHNTVMVEGLRHHLCPNCHKLKPMSDFYKGNVGKCKQCHRELDKDIYKIKKTIVLSRRRTSYQKNREAILKHKANYRELHRERARIYAVNYRKIHGNALVNEYRKEQRRVNANVRSYFNGNLNL
jgi:hypothetical protein